MRHKSILKPKVLESELQAEIVSVAKKLSYMTYHTYNSQRSDFGWPDLVCANEDKHRVLFIECKSDAGKPSDEQLAWLDALARCDQEVYIVYPKHLDEIIQILMLAEKPSVAQRMVYDCSVVVDPSQDSAG